MTMRQCARFALRSASRPTFARGEAAQERAQEAGKRASRWIVERSHRGMNRFRRILVRWEKKPPHYLAFLHYACALIALRASRLFG